MVYYFTKISQLNKKMSFSSDDQLFKEDCIIDEKKFFTGYQSNNYVYNNNTRNILQGLKPYTFSEEIKNMADTIYNKMVYRVRRKKIRNQLLFYCVYCAHIELGIFVNPVKLGLVFDLNSGEIQKCDSLFSPLQTGYCPPAQNISPINYLREYCKILGLSSETCDSIAISSRDILEKDNSLEQENPQTVAAGLLKYYIVINGIQVDLQRIMEITGRSSITIDSVYRRVSTIDNS